MIKFFRGALEMTGLALILLSAVAIWYGGQVLCIETVFQTFFACLLIQLGLKLLQRFESRYFLVEIMLELTFVLVVLVSFGYLFGWYNSLPLPTLVLLGTVVYVIGCIAGIRRVSNDLESINNQLHRGKV